jgi:hypothetical protein
MIGINLDVFSSSRIVVRPTLDSYDIKAFEDHFRLHVDGVIKSITIKILS